MRPCSVVVLSKFAEIFAGLKEQLDVDARDCFRITIWDTGEKPFHIARSANQGWQLRREEDDILYAGDDTRIIEPDTIKRIQEVADSDPQIGIVAARIKGHSPKRYSEPFTAEPFVAFVFVYIKREVIEKVGYLDERFEGYGCEDIDYCYRARKAGFKVGFANQVTIQHGLNGNEHQTTFRRVKTQAQIDAEDRENWRRFAEKWNLPNDRGLIWKAIQKLS